MVRFVILIYVDVGAKILLTFTDCEVKSEKVYCIFCHILNVIFIIDAVKQGANFTTQEVENAIKRWLKHAPNRNKKSE